jgi:hypothetical protein
LPGEAADVEEVSRLDADSAGRELINDLDESVPAPESEARVFVAYDDCKYPATSAIGRETEGVTSTGIFGIRFEHIEIGCSYESNSSVSSSS